MELSAIKGIGPTRLESLRAVGVCSLRDLLYFLPQRYEDRTHPIPCADANGGEVLVMGVVQDAPKLSRFNGLTRVTAYLWDDSGKLPLAVHVNLVDVVPQHQAAESSSGYQLFHEKGSHLGGAGSRQDLLLRVQRKEIPAGLLYGYCLPLILSGDNPVKIHVGQFR